MNPIVGFTTLGFIKGNPNVFNEIIVWNNNFIKSAEICVKNFISLCVISWLSS